MAAPTFVQTKAWVEGGVSGKRRKAIMGYITFDGTVGANYGDIPASLFSGVNGAWTTVEEVLGGINSTNTLAVDYNTSYDLTCVFTFAPSTNAPANATAGTYLITVKGN